MAYKTLIFGKDDIYKNLKPFYEAQVELGNLELVAAVGISKKGLNNSGFDLAIISSKNDFYRRMKLLEAQGFPRDRIIDGRVFKMPNLDFARFLKEGIACGTLDEDIFEANLRIMYPKIYRHKNGRITLSLGRKSYIRLDSRVEGRGTVSLGNFSSFAKRISFSLGLNHSHNYKNVGMVPWSSLDWEFPKSFWPSRGSCKILIGNDVWCGQDSTFKSVNPEKPLIIGDGAVIASNSVVVKNVPPYAIVGGNPAKIIKYRFEPHVIEALLKIKWWDWDIDKIHDNFKYFNDVEKFISLHDNLGGNPMAYKTLVFGTDDIYSELKPLYDEEVKRGNLKIVATKDVSGGVISYSNDKIDLAIISSSHNFYKRMKLLEARGFPRNRIIDGRVFRIPNLNFTRFLKEGVACGVFEDKNAFSDKTGLSCPRIYTFKNAGVTLNLGVKSRINAHKNSQARIECFGKENEITFGNFSGISWNALFEIGLNGAHNPRALSLRLSKFDWKPPKKFHQIRGHCKIDIQNDVWLGRGCILKSSNPEKPLIIGDGAVVAADSVVVKNVPPYAIVGGNPAQIIKYRFEPHVIEALLRIKWWDWDIDKIHDNFKYFDDVEKFISLHDRS